MCMWRRASASRRGARAAAPASSDRGGVDTRRQRPDPAGALRDLMAGKHTLAMAGRQFLDALRPATVPARPDDEVATAAG
jgi:hypothetical protein